MKHIFVSYARKDDAFAENLVKALESTGYTVWKDSQSLVAGQSWTDGIQNGILEAGLFILIMSKTSKNSEWVERELLTAQNNNIPILPILLNGKSFFEVINIQYVDMQKQDGRILPEKLKKVLASTFEQAENTLEVPRRTEGFPVNGKNLSLVFVLFIILLILAFIYFVAQLNSNQNPIMSPIPNSEILFVQSPETNPSLQANQSPSNIATFTATATSSPSPSATLDSRYHVPLSTISFSAWAMETGIPFDEQLNTLASTQANHLISIPYPNLATSNRCLDSFGRAIDVLTAQEGLGENFAIFISIYDNTDTPTSLNDFLQETSNLNIKRYGYAEILARKTYIVIVFEAESAETCYHLP